MSMHMADKTMDANDPKEVKDWGVDVRDGNRTRQAGVVKRTHPSAGYIWIAGDDEVDYFGHISQIQVGVEIRQLRIGQKCTFVATHPPRGPAAELIEFEMAE